MIVSALAFAGLDLVRKLLAGRIDALALVLFMSLGAVPFLAVLLAFHGLEAPSSGYFLPGLGALTLNFLGESGLRALAQALTSEPDDSAPLAHAGFHRRDRRCRSWGSCPRPTQVLGIVLVVAGAVALNFDGSARGLLQERGALLMASVALMWAVSGPLDKLAIGHASVYFHATAMSFGVGIGALAALVWQGRLAALRSARGEARLLIVAMICITLALDLSAPRHPRRPRLSGRGFQESGGLRHGGRARSSRVSRDGGIEAVDLGRAHGLRAIPDPWLSYSFRVPEYDAFLLVSFGGPEGREDVLPFLRNVVRGKNVPEERLRAVAEHYYRFDGVSPLNGENRRLLEALEGELALPLYWGNRNWHPLLEDTMKRMAENGVRRALAFATSAYSSYSGCRQYLEDIERARAAVGEGAPLVDKIPPFFDHPGIHRGVPPAPDRGAEHDSPPSGVNPRRFSSPPTASLSLWRRTAITRGSSKTS